MINLPASQTLVELEKVLIKLAAPGNARLQIPTEPTLTGIWSRAMLLQTIITWARRNPDAALVTYTDFSAKENLVEKIVRREHGLIGALVAGRIVSNERQADLTVGFRAAAQDRLRTMSAPQPVVPSVSLLPGFEGLESSADEGTARRGTVALALSADALGPLAYPRQLYNFEGGVPRVRSADEFGDWILAEFSGQRKADALRLKRPSLPKLKLLGRCLAELFSNTHKFARTSITGATLPRSVRGMLTDVAKDAGRKFDPNVEPPAIQAFLRTLSSRHGAGTGVMEIDVFDSGPGMAQHWLGREVREPDGLNMEMEAVQSCLQKWGTRGGDESRGLGLHTIMKILSNSEIGGMLFIRTGRLALIRDLHADPLDVTPGAAKQLDTYRMSHLFDRGSLGRIEGTLISLLIPTPVEGSP